MQYRKLAHSDLSISHICLGTMTWGEQNSEADAHAQLDYAVAQGINFIDTAEMYPVPAKAETQGSTERYLGSWLKKQDRSKLVIATKAAGPRRGMPWMRGGPQFTKDQLIAACDASLQRLQTDYIDLYQLHWPARHVPMFGQSYFNPAEDPEFAPTITEQLEALQALIAAGKVRYVGVSNESAWGIMRFVQEAGSSLPRIVSTQNVYNLINRGFDHGLTEVCHRENIGLLAYSPLAFGLLSGKYVSNPDTIGRMTLFANFGTRYLKPQVPTAVAAYAELAQSYGLTPAQLALAWMYSRWYVTSTILGATSLAQLQENIGAASVVITPELEAGIEAIHRASPSPAQ